MLTCMFFKALILLLTILMNFKNLNNLKLKINTIFIKINYK